MMARRYIGLDGLGWRMVGASSLTYFAPFRRYRVPGGREGGWNVCLVLKGQFVVDVPPRFCYMGLELSLVP